jgi:HlyD family secretion protein
MLLGVLMLVAMALVAYGFFPKPIDVDEESITRGELLETVNEEGKTRIKERYDVLAPLSGQLLRIDLHAGDEVVAGKTVLAVIEPSDPSLLDARTLAESEARVNAALAGQMRAVALQERARAAADLADIDFNRAEKLHGTGSVSQEQFDAFFHRRRLATEELRSAEFAVQIAKYETDVAKAALLSAQAKEGSERRFTLLSPIDGKVLKVIRESAGAVMVTTPLLQLGNPADLEVEIDVLSRDASRMTPGCLVRLGELGRPAAWEGRIRQIEPQAFTKISALGVEEQRVNVIVDFLQPSEVLGRLGDGYALETKIVVWSGSNIVKVPSASLFRLNHGWGVYVVDNGHARLREVKVGHTDGRETEVVEGLTVDEKVVLYPSDRVTDSGRVRPRS